MPKGQVAFEILRRLQQGPILVETVSGLVEAWDPHETNCEGPVYATSWPTRKPDR
jgi:hypothetical protein